MPISVGGSGGSTVVPAPKPTPTTTTKPVVDPRGYVPEAGGRYGSPITGNAMIWDPAQGKYVPNPNYTGPGANLRDTTRYIYGGGTAVAGGGADGQIVYQVAEDGTRKPLINPETGAPVRFGDNARVWANVEAYLNQYGSYPFAEPTGIGGGGYGGGGGGYGYGGGGGGETTYYPQFDYNAAQGEWNRYITKHGFGQQDRQGDWARDYYNQSLLEFNTDWAKQHPAVAIPKEGTTVAPDVAQTSDYTTYLKRAFGRDSLPDIYASLSGQRRGDQYSRYGGAGRTLSWG